MPAARSDPHHGLVGAASSTNVWGTWLVRLSFGAALAAAVVVLEPVALRMGKRLPSDRPAARERVAPAGQAANPRQEDVVEAETGLADRDGAVPSPLLAFAEVIQALAPSRVERADAPVRLPDVLPADRAIEQRLRASEEDLRAELRGLAEVRLLSDGDVQKARKDERAAQERLLKPAQASMDAAGNRMKAAQASVAQISLSINGDPRDPFLRDALQQAVGGTQVAGRAWVVAVDAYRRAAERAPQDRERIGYEFDLQLHLTLQKVAARAGLALLSKPNCQLSQTTAAQVAELSKELRDKGFVSIPGGQAAGSWKTQEFQAWCDQQHWEGMSGTVPTLAQMLQIEDEAKRLLLVHALSRIPSAAATTQLAVRAIVDLSPAVRRAALAGLEHRPWGPSGPVLLRGLRYPWPPVADHAAVALRTLQLREAVIPLVEMLELPSPSAPLLDARTSQYVVREVVRVNHLRNCLLCHAPSANKDDGLVRALVPTPREPLPVQYYESPGGHFVRADITFLRQDFSVNLPEEDAAPWPRDQRYDFVTRLRILSPGAVTDSCTSSGPYPQRDAVLYALRGLTGKDGGASSARWRELLGLSAGNPDEEKERPALEKITASLAGTDRPR